MGKSGPPRRSSRPPPPGVPVVEGVTAILRADLDSAELILDDLEEITSVEAAVIQEAGIDDEWEDEPPTVRMPEGKLLQLREKCR